MKLSKDNTNFLRGAMRELVNATMRHTTNCDLFCKWLDTYTPLHFRKLVDKDAFLKLQNYLKIFNIEIEKDEFLNEIKAKIKNLHDSLQIDLEKLQILMHAISQDGMKTVTYFLPIIFIAAQVWEPEFNLLLLSGIKKNAQSKLLEAKFMDPLEYSLLELERQMTNFIEDDLNIEVENCGKFLVLFAQYLQLFYSETEMKIVNADVADKNILMRGYKKVMRSMMYYIVGRVTDSFELFHIREYSEIIRIDDIDFDNEQSLKTTVEKVMKEIASKAEILRSVKKAAQITNKKPLDQKKESIDPLKEYMTNGVITKSCNLEEFKKILENTDLSPDRKNEYFAQMRNLINRNAQAKFEKAMNECRSKTFTKEEMDLYTNAKTDPACKSIIEDIDTIIEMLLGELTQEEQKTLRIELNENIDMLRLMLTPKVKNEPEIEQGIIYYSDTVLDEEGNLSSVPKIYQAVLKDGKEVYRQVYSQITKLKQGLINGNGIVKAKGNWPCKVYYRGKEYKVYYTIIEDVVVVIDAGKRGVSIDKVVGNERFAFFIDAVKGALAQGQVINDERQEAILMEELEKVNTFKLKN